MSSRTVFITGATNGVGRVVVERVGALGWHVLAHGQDEQRGEQLLKNIVASGGTSRFFRADLASVADTRNLAKTIASEAPQLPLLFNNAGVGFGAPGEGRQTSADGDELRLAVNYLAPFVPTWVLMPNLAAAAPARSSMLLRSDSAS